MTSAGIPVSDLSHTLGNCLLLLGEEIGNLNGPAEDKITPSIVLFKRLVYKTENMRSGGFFHTANATGSCT